MAHAETRAAEDRLAEFLGDLFRAFNAAGIDYAVARDYELLPRGLHGRDLDVLVKEADFERAYEVSLAVARSHGAKLFKIDQEADTYAWLFVVHWDQPSWGIHIDLLRPRCNNWRGCYFLDETAALERKELVNGVFTLRSEDIIFMQFCRGIVGNLYLREKYREPAVRLYLGNPRQFQNDLKRIFGKRHAVALVRTCAEQRFEDVAALGMTLRRAILVRNFLWSPGRAIKDMLQYVLWRLREYLRPNGILVVIMGGKAGGNQALTEGIRREIHRIVRSKIRIYPGRPGLLPSLRAPRSCPTKSNPGHALHFWRLSYELVDCVLGYWFLVRPYLGRKCVAAVFDGYLCDYLVGSRRSVPKFLRRLVPKPDLLVLLSSEQKTDDILTPAGQTLTQTMARALADSLSTERVENVACGQTAAERVAAANDIVRMIFETLWLRLGNVKAGQGGMAVNSGKVRAGETVEDGRESSDCSQRESYGEWTN